MGGAAGFVCTSLAVVTFLGKSSPSPLHPGGFCGTAEMGCRRCQAGHRPGYATRMLRCSAGTYLSVFCGCSEAEDQFSWVVDAGRGCVLYHSRKLSCTTSLVPLKKEDRNC